MAYSKYPLSRGSVALSSSSDKSFWPKSSRFLTVSFKTVFLESSLTKSTKTFWLAYAFSRLSLLPLCL